MRSGATRALVGVLVLMMVMLGVSLALAAPHLSTSLNPDTIEVGDNASFVVVASGTDNVTEAQLAVPNGVTVVGQQASPSYQVTIANGQMTQVVSTRVVFRIRASREGNYTVGPATITSGGHRYSGDRASLRVVAKGTLPQRQPNPFDPFGLFGSGSPFDVFREPQTQILEPDYPIDPRYNLDRAVEPTTFLHATVDKTRAVVGEQVTLAVYVYAEVSESPELADPHEVGTSDFLRQPLLKPDASVERVAFARVAGRTYQVALLRKFALFPLHTGDLEITPMRLRISRLGERQSETLKVHVTDPPLEHRPAGYTLGDVGRFTLSADVAPREVERGAAIAVNVELSGWGNLPASLTVPARPGVTWLEPEVKEDLHVLDQASAGAPDVWGGSRRFSYVVTPKKEGDIDLGEIAVSFFDPRTRAYDVARAALGVIHVKPGAQPVAEESKIFANMPPLRTQLAGGPKAESYLDDSPRVFWGLLGGPTTLFALSVGVRRAARRIADRSKERKTSPLAELKTRQKALAAAEDGDNGRTLDGASIRVVEAASTVHAGVNVRGVGGEAVAEVLERAGVDKGTAAELRDLLEACAAARFSPDGVSITEARKRAARARALVERLADKSPASERG